MQVDISIPLFWPKMGPYSIPRSLSYFDIIYLIESDKDLAHFSNDLLDIHYVNWSLTPLQ